MDLANKYGWEVLPDNVPCPFKHDYKIKFDGSHFIASIISHQKKKQHRHVPNELELKFNYAYDIGMRALEFEPVSDNKFKIKLRDFVYDNLDDGSIDSDELNTFIDDSFDKKDRNLWARKKRLKDKVLLNPWNYFVTFTYSNDKQSEESFLRKLRRCLSNLAFRRKWRYCGVTERGSKTGRLHFHFFMFIPNGQMIGELRTERSYQFDKHQMELVHINSFFEKKFGRNDFAPIDNNEIRFGDSLIYMMKYLGKSNRRIIYSRGISSCIIKSLYDGELICEMVEPGRYVIADNVIDFVRDIWSNIKGFVNPFREYNYILSS